MTPVFRTTKLWLGLGAFVFVQAGAAAPDAAAQGAGAQGIGAQEAGATPAIPAPAQGGEGGEGGEGGVSAEQAATDPAAFLSALDVVAAHYLAGRDAYGAGQPQAAAEMFAHPIGEVYAEMEPVFEARGVAPFRDAMQTASDLALAGAPRERVGAATDAVLAALTAAAAKAPAPGATVAVQARVAAEFVDRAALQYAAAARDPAALEPYLDGYGFHLAAKARAEKALPALEAAGRRDVAERMRAALGTLARAFPGPARPAGLPAVDAGALLAEASRLKILTGALP